MRRRKKCPADRGAEWRPTVAEVAASAAGRAGRRAIVLCPRMPCENCVNKSRMTSHEEQNLKPHCEREKRVEARVLI